ncbi:MAG: DUF547 domain-containing protein, partial [Planctomycetota bacterium]
AYAAFDKVTPTSKPTGKPDASGVSQNVWDYLLKKYVAGGLVDYDGMKKDYQFAEYIRELGSCNPNALKKPEDRLALMCNAYNAFVINGVITHRKPPKVNEFKINGVDFFNLKEHIFAGKTISLNQLEHKMIRPIFKEPRIHVALVCAAKSCPAIRAEAYDGKSIDTQLQDQSVQFANNKNYVAFDVQKNELKLSPILNWYGQDWDQKYPNGGYLQWLTELVEDQTLKSQIEKVIAGNASKSFFVYDWNLNAQSAPKGHGGGGGSGDFGSGSIPDE